MTNLRLDMEGYLQDAAATAGELQDEIYEGHYSDYSDDSAWDVQNAALELMACIRRFREQNAGPSDSNAEHRMLQSELI